MVGARFIGTFPRVGSVRDGPAAQRGYLVAEGYMVLQWFTAKRDGNRDRDEYQALASDVARRRFGTNRPIGTWKYYETMEEELESGVFDRIPGGALDPETDESTYNGKRWRLARENFWRNPDVPPSTTSSEYQRALAAYQADAIRDEFRWSWRDAQLQKDVYVQTIRSVNRSYKRAASMVSLLGARSSGQRYRRLRQHAHSPLRWRSGCRPPT